MGSVFHPIGSQPPWVYWARRAALVLAALLVVAAVIWVFRPQPDAPVTAVPGTSSASASGTAGASASPSDSPSASPTPTGPLACDATNSGLTLAGYQKVKQNAKQPFRVSVTNTGAQPCILDLKPATFSLTVTSGADRIWSTDDCPKWVPAHKQTLNAKKVYEFTVDWPVTRSAAGCKTAKSILGTGTYVATAAFATDAKARQVFVVTKAK